MVSGWTPVVILAAVAAVMVAVALVLPRSHSGPSLKGLTPSQILQVSVTAASKAQTLHILDHETQAGQPLVVEGDITPDGGSITATEAGHVVSVEAVGQTDYFKADAAFLGAVNIDPARAQAMVGRWFSIPASSSTDLSQMAASLKTSVVVNDLIDLAGPVTETASTAGTVTLVGSIPDNPVTHGSGAGDQATLVVSARSPFFPLSITYSDPQNGSSDTQFSLWGENVTVAAPASAVPLSDLVAPSADEARLAQMNLRNALTAEQTYWTDNQAFDTTAASSGGVEQLLPSLHFITTGTVAPGQELLVGADHNAVVLTAAGSDGNCYSVEAINDPGLPVAAGTYFYEAAGVGRGQQTRCGAPKALAESLHATPSSRSAASSPGTWSLSF